MSFENLTNDSRRGGVFEGGILVLIKRHETNSIPEINVALARVARANPNLSNVLLSMIG